jgi:hypothetical protein
VAAALGFLPPAPAQGSRGQQLRPARDEAKLVVTRFLLASALGDRRTACALFPTFPACGRPSGFRGPAAFAVVSVKLADREQPVVVAEVGGIRGALVLRRAGGRLAIAHAAQVLLPLLGAASPGSSARRPTAEEANLVVTRFLVASALGDRRTACSLFPAYFPCRRGDRFAGTADFNVVSITAADPGHPVVFANIDGVRGYFVLERVGQTLRIVTAALD